MKLALVFLAFSGSIAMTMLILACTVPENKQWWPMIVVVFYLLSPLPTLIAHPRQQSSSGTSCMDFAIFITMGFVISSYALPFVLARSDAIEYSASYFTFMANTMMYLTFIGFFMTLYHDENNYGIWG